MARTAAVKDESIGKSRIVLVTGGARSGKSVFAESYVAAAAGAAQQVGYVATAQILDEEMQFRVRRHQERRPASWQTWEAQAPEQAAEALRAAGAACDAVLFDCVTLFLSNLICSLTEAELADEAAAYGRVQEAISCLLNAARQVTRAWVTVFVTNEVGAGIVPESRLGRSYRDLAGLANQQLAAAADAVYLVACGQAVELKRASLTAAQAASRDLR